MRESLMEFYFVIVMRLSLDNREATISFRKLIEHELYSIGWKELWPYHPLQYFGHWDQVLQCR
jgi:hypothetical protein